MKILTHTQLEDEGFFFDSGFRGWISSHHTLLNTKGEPDSTDKHTLENLEILCSYMNQEVPNILTEIQGVRSIFPEVKKSCLEAKQHNFGVSVRYGDPQFMSAGGTLSSRVHFIYEVQQQVAKGIYDYINEIYLFGIGGRKIYGLLNYPTLFQPIAPLPTGENSSPLWSKKDVEQWYKDIDELYKTLQRQTFNHVTLETPTVLCISAQLDTYLGQKHTKKLLQQMVNETYPRLQFVTIDGLSISGIGESMLLIAKELHGKKTGEFVYSERLRTYPVIPGKEELTQKWSASTYGCVIHIPEAIAYMRGL